jgi:hypothetical protein
MVSYHNDDTRESQWVMMISYVEAVILPVSLPQVTIHPTMPKLSSRQKFITVIIQVVYIRAKNLFVGDAKWIVKAARLKSESSL